MLNIAANEAKQPQGGERLPPLRVVNDRNERLEILERGIRRAVRSAPLRILEAGCGTTWPLHLDGVEYALTGIDLDANALATRQRTARPEDRLLRGDLRERQLFGAGQFDVIYNSFVLEHVDGAERVLDNFLYWLGPEGVLVLRIPDRDSVYGFITRVTPLWFHVLYKKYVRGMANAGKPGYDPFPTYYDDVVSRRGMHRYCRERGCTVREEAGSANYLPRRGLAALCVPIVVRLVALASLGKLTWRHNNLTFVIQK